MNNKLQNGHNTSGKFIVICGAGGFIGTNLVRYFYRLGVKRLRAVCFRQLPFWYEKLPGIDYMMLDLSKSEDCRLACEGADEVYNLAGDVGGLGFMSSCHVESMRNVLINTHLLEAAWCCGVRKYFFASSACIYDVARNVSVIGEKLTEEDALPARPERGYGWERLFSEILCQEYWKGRGLRTFIARLNNVYGPYCCFEGDRVRVIPSLCRSVIRAKESQDNKISVWGDGTQLRTFLHVSDCVRGIDLLTQCNDCVGKPVNLSSCEAVSVNDLLATLERISGVGLSRIFDMEKPVGVHARILDTSLAKKLLRWSPEVSLVEGVSETFSWICSVCSSVTC